MCPLYEYEHDNHFFEAVRPASAYMDDVPCIVPGCDKMAHRVLYSLCGVGESRPLVSNPTVIFRGPNGHTLYPGNANEKPPSGYERVELRTTAEKRAFVKEMNFNERMDHEQREIARQAHFEEVQSENRRQLFHEMQSMTPAGRDFAMASMRKTNSRRRGRPGPEFCLPVLEYDASNRREHRDVETDWRPRK